MLHQEDTVVRIEYNGMGGGAIDSQLVSRPFIYIPIANAKQQNDGM